MVLKNNNSYMDGNCPKLNLLIPLYNEEVVYSELIERLTKLIESFQESVSVILVDDGSSDKTAELMEQTSKADRRFTSIFLSRNFGHQLALTAGLAHVDATEAVLILDGDLQDPPELLDELYSHFKNGYDVVYAIRQKRKEGFLKRMAYKGFYILLNKISYINIPLDTGDFSLISRRVVDQLNQMKEESRFLRGMRSWIGYKQIGVVYERSEREAGDSKYSVKKLLQLAFNGIFNFSEFPIKFISRLGIFTITVSLVYLMATLIRRFVYDVVPEGFTALLFTIILFGGVQLLSIGILGEYILRIFFQVKDRPLFIVRSVIKDKEEKVETK
jgi:dolichol-phosphate mannosyltransferase